jgi:broad specificity phosphatase PhoE
MSPILFIRHAETDLAGTFCGHSDPPINARGQRQIQDLLRALEGKTLDAIYASDLQRAVTTGEALAAAFNAPLVTTSALREIGFGQWEGLTWSQIERKDATRASRWLEDYPYLAPPGGESFEVFESRVRGEVERLVALAGDKCFAVVTHAGVMRFVLRALCGCMEQDAWRRTESYCCFFEYAYEVKQ